MRILATALALACLGCAPGAPAQEPRLEAGTIRGMVLGPEGHAVPGVLVATTHPESPLWRDVLDAASISGKSELDGRFELRGVAPGTWRVAAYSPACPQAEGTSIELREGEGLEEVVVRLARPSATPNPLRVRVVDPQGKSIPYARLLCSPRPGCANGDPAFPDAKQGGFTIQRMPGQRVSLRAWLDQFPQAAAVELLAAAYAVDVPAEQGEIELQLTSRPAHTLVVVDEEGKPIRGFQWRALDEQQFLRRDNGAIVRNGFGLAIDSFRAGPTPAGQCMLWPITEAQHSGNRDVEQIPDPASRFLVQVLADGFEPAEVGPFRSTNAPMEIRVVLRRSPELRGVVLANGAPVAGALVRLLVPHPPGAEYGRALWPENERPTQEELYDERERVTTSSDGSFTFTPSALGRCILRAGIEPAAEAEVGPFDLPLRESLTGLRVELPHRGAIEGKVRTRPGHDVSGKFVLATRNLGEDPLVAPIEAGGAFRFEKLAPGRWTLHESTHDPFAPTPGFSGCRAAPQERRAAATDPFTCEVRPDETTHVEIDLTRTVHFSAHVDLSGWDMTSLDLEMLPIGSTFAEYKLARSNGPGQEVAVDLDQAGEYWLTLRPRRFPDFDSLVVQERVALHEGENSWSLQHATGNLLVRCTKPIVSTSITLRDGQARVLRFSLHSAETGEFLIADVPEGFWRTERQNPYDPIIPDVATVEAGKTAELELH